MTVTLELSPDVEQAIERKARRQGITPSEYLRRIAERAARPRASSKPHTAQVHTARPQTGAEILAQLKALDIPKGYGDPSIDSPELARQLRERFSRPNREAGD